MTKSATGTVDVILDANGAPVMAAIERAFKRVKDIDRITGDIQKKAAAAAEAFTKGSGQSMQNFDKMLKRMDSLERSLQAAARQPITRQANDKAFANQIRRVYDFKQGLDKASTAAQAFEARLNAIDKKAVALGNGGRIDSRLMSKRLGLEQAEKDFKRLQREIEQADRLARRSGITGDRSGLAAAEAGLFGALKRGRVNVKPQLDELHRQADLYIAGIRTERARIAKESAAASKSTPGLFGATGVGGIIARTGAYGGAAALIYGAINTIKTGIGEAIKFEDTLHKIAGVAGLTSTQMTELGGTIMSVAENSRFARQEIAEATTVLAQAGFSSTDIQNSLKAINNLAAASGSTFAEVTDVITSAVGAFQLNAAEAEKIADELAAALNMTKLNIQQVALGIQYAGATAYENNLTFEDLTATFAALAQAGIRSGSTMGTGLRQLLTDLLTPSKKMVEELKKLGLGMDDINVKTRGLDGVIKTLADSGFGAAEAYQGLEVRAAAAYLALKNHQDVALKVALAQSQQAAATDGAAKAMGSLAGQWQQFKNILNDNVTNGLIPYEKALSDVFMAFKRQNDQAREFAQVQEAFARNFGDTAEGVQKANDAMVEYRNSLYELEARQEANAQASERVETAVNKAAEATEHEKQVLDSVDNALNRVSVRKETLIKDSAALAAETLNLEGRFSGLAAMLQGTALSYDSLTKALLRYRTAQLSLLGLRAGEEANAAMTAANQYSGAASQSLRSIHATSWFQRLPAYVKTAIEDARSKTGVDRAQAVTIINNYANDPRSKLPPLWSGMLKDYTGNVAKMAQQSSKYNDSRMLQDTAAYLSSKTGQSYMQRIQDTNDPAALRKLMSEIAGQAKRAPGGALGAAWNELLQQASSKLSLAEPPTPDKVKTPKGPNLEHKQDKINLDIARQAMRASEMALDNSIKDVTSVRSSLPLGPDDIPITGKGVLTSDRITKNVDAVQENLQQWIADRWKLADAQIDRDDMGGMDANSFKMQVAREIEEKKKETARAVSEQLVKGLEAMIAVTEDVAAQAEQVADHQLAMAAAKLKSLDRVSARGGYVPDYVTAHYQTLNAKAQDQRDLSQVGINENRIKGLTQDLGVFEDAQRKWESDHPEMKGQLSEFYNKIRDTRREIEALTNSNIELRASFENVLPQTLNQELNQMLENWRKIHGMNMSLNQDLANLAGQGLDKAYEGFQTFFSDILTGTKTVKQAFADFAKSMIQALEQLIAQFVAKQFFKWILSAIGGPSLGVDTTGTGQFNGGEVRGAYRGEYIQDGVPTRDSTMRKLAKGEFVMRRAAVQSVGVDFMRRLNDQGSLALRPSAIQPAAPVNQQVAVYVVKEDEKPQMGPKDVLVTVHDDILKGGATKKLIKLVSQGA